MAYLGNDLQVAYQSYQIIDDISSSFNGVLTTFPLQVGGVTPVPFPINPQQCLISVNGVIQEPDPSGTSGFNLVGSNIVFSSAPTGGHAFFGVILAGADYVNVGVNYPSGSESAPSITFDTDLDTGIYNPAANELGFSTNSIQRLKIESDGDINIDNGGVFYDATNNRLAIGTTSPDGLLTVRPSSGNSQVFIRTNDTTSRSQLIFGDSADNNVGGVQYDHSDDSLQLHVGNIGEKVRLDSSGRLLVGTSSAATAGNSQYALLAVKGNTLSSGSGGLISLQRGEASASGNITAGENIGGLVFGDTDGQPYASILCDADGTSGTGDYPGRLVFSTTADGASSPTERMRIKSDGTVATANGFGIGNIANAIANAFYIASSAITSGAGNSTLKYNTNSGLVTYDTSSRLVKENIEDCPYGIEELKQLQPRKYFRTDDQREEIGFVADEMIEVMPEFVPIGPRSVITKNNEDTEQIPLGVNYEKLTAVLTKTLQEAIGEIESLKARVAALESA